MKKFLFLLIAAGGLFVLAGAEADAQHWRGYYGHRPVPRGGGITIGIGRGFGYGYGPRHYPVRRSLGISYGYYPRTPGGYYGRGFYGGGGYYGGYYGGCGY